MNGIQRPQRNLGMDCAKKLVGFFQGDKVQLEQMDLLSRHELLKSMPGQLALLCGEASLAFLHQERRLHLRPCQLRRGKRLTKQMSLVQFAIRLRSEQFDDGATVEIHRLLPTFAVAVFPNYLFRGHAPIPFGHPLEMLRRSEEDFSSFAGDRGDDARLGQSAARHGDLMPFGYPVE